MFLRVTKPLQASKPNFNTVEKSEGEKVFVGRNHMVSTV